MASKDRASLSGTHCTSSQFISVDNFLSSVVALPEIDVALAPETEPANALELTARRMRISNEMAAELATVCDPSATLYAEPEIRDRVVEILDDVSLTGESSLTTVQHQAHEIMKRKVDKAYHSRCRESTNLRPKHLYSTNVSKTCDESRLEQAAAAGLIPGCLLHVQIYRPLDHRGKFKYHVDQEIVMLHNQTLSELRDIIVCQQDLFVPGEFSEDPSIADQMPRARELFKSGVFFIEDTFYNDTRSESAIDYSKPIRDFLKKRQDIHYLKTANMQTTRLSDLSLRLGYPYLYIHQGQCEHLVMFGDMKVIDAKLDSLNPADYPRTVFKSRRRRVVCRGCVALTARWAVHNSEHCPEDPCYLCDSCFRMFHYDEDGNKIGNFKAHVFVDRTAV